MNYEQRTTNLIFFNQTRPYLTTKSKKNKKFLSPSPASIYANPASKIGVFFRIKRAHPCIYRGIVFFGPQLKGRKSLSGITNATYSIRN
ncbi:MAG TPA: hypothetical protein VM123_13795, partial [archaeon]|nr:hypothetical protein [archaeon]